MIEWWITLILMVGSFGLGYGVANREARRDLDKLETMWDSSRRDKLIYPTQEEIKIGISRARSLTLGKDRSRHHHQYVEFYFGCYADEPGGPRTYHGIGWACACGKWRI